MTTHWIALAYGTSLLLMGCATAGLLMLADALGVDAAALFERVARR